MVCLEPVPQDISSGGRFVREFEFANLHPGGPEPKLFLSVTNQRNISSKELARILHRLP
jgi:hypothetical protein